MDDERTVLKMPKKHYVSLFLTVALAFVLIACDAKIETGHLSGFSSEDGLAYELFVPAHYDGETPLGLVMMLHGGGQTAADIALLSRLDDYAEIRDLFVLYPEQSVSANSDRYWNWFLSQNQARGTGEPALLASLLGEVMDAYAIDPDRVIVAGFSAGGCMAITLGILYPDLFAGFGAAGAVGYGAASDVVSAFAAMNGTLPDPELAAAAIDLATPAMVRRPLKALFIHGTTDARVDVTNVSYAIDVLALLNGRIEPDFPDLPTATNRYEPEGRLAFTVRDYAFGENVELRSYIVEGMAHRWPGAPAAETYGEPLAPDFSELILSFFFAIE
ncbi:MAG: hypothetical protein A2Y16_05200 [Tenericutes bacterium GWF2_57_13]|nr:MAG: hypothetical protein A2Y16_05200 [Tenericutes bacterium GWF2_57_13]